MDNALEVALQTLYRQNFGQLVASVTRLTGDMQLAEDSIQEAFIKAADTWADGQVPAHANAWLMTTARNSALDQIRRTATLNKRLPEVALMEELSRPTSTNPQEEEVGDIKDDMLRLIFTCCHPALNIESRVALCLNTVCGLRTDEIARAFIVTDATMSQRLWRAKSKIRDAGIAYRVPGADELGDRTSAVLAVIYLIFNEGWLASAGEEALRNDLAEEAIRLARLMLSLLEQDLESRALLGLMLLQHSRRLARFDEDGRLILLRDQDRQLWDQRCMSEGTHHVRSVFSAGGGNTRYAIMGAIACVHANAQTASATDWTEIAALYEHMMAIDPSAVVALNYAVAIGERDGPEAGLRQVMQLAESATMQRYYLFYSTQADFLRRLQRTNEAKDAYARAIELAENAVEKDFLAQQLEAIS